MTISTKWPAARLIGPDVSVENALEFIRRTEEAFAYGFFTNDRVFEAQFKRLMNLGDDWSARERFRKDFGSIDLEHLSSNWVAAAYIGGPTGPVSPSGRVSLAKNFGKYPSCEEVEADLDRIASEFPWLSFTLGVWGHLEEGDDGLPSDMWKLSDGKWERAEPAEMRWPHPFDISTFVSALSQGNRRETTWTIEHIDRMWGDKIRSSVEAAKRGASE